jgi:hypothetical protein
LTTRREAAPAAAREGGGWPFIGRRPTPFETDSGRANDRESTRAAPGAGTV